MCLYTYVYVFDIFSVLVCVCCICSLCVCVCLYVYVHVYMCLCFVSPVCFVCVYMSVGVYICTFVCHINVLYITLLFVAYLHSRGSGHSQCYVCYVCAHDHTHSSHQCLTITAHDPLATVWRWDVLPRQTISSSAARHPDHLYHLNICKE